MFFSYPYTYMYEFRFAKKNNSKYDVRANYYYLCSKLIKKHSEWVTTTYC